MGKNIEIIIDDEKDKHKIQNLRALVSKEEEKELKKINLSENKVTVSIKIEERD